MLALALAPNAEVDDMPENQTEALHRLEIAMTSGMAELRGMLAPIVTTMKDHEERIRAGEEHRREAVTWTDLDARSRRIYTILGLVISGVGVGVAALALSLTHH